jgi:hypothetical protein
MVRTLLSDEEITRERIRLQCLGIKSEGVHTGRKGGAGPTGGRSMIFPNGTLGNVPLRGNFVKGKFREKFTIYAQGSRCRSIRNLA